MRKQWLNAALIRAIKTVAQTAVATIGVSSVMSEVDWPMVASASVLAGILSILTSVAGLPEVEEADDLDDDLRDEDEDFDEDEEGEEDDDQ